MLRAVRVLLAAALRVPQLDVRPMHADEIEQTMVELTPMARLGEVEDIALGALYLCSPAASYVTGDILGVNGGLERLNMQMPRAWGGMG